MPDKTDIFSDLVKKLKNSTERISFLLDQEIEKKTHDSEKLKTLYDRRQISISALEQIVNSSVAKDIFENADDETKRNYQLMLIEEKKNIAKLKQISQIAGAKLKNLSKQKSLLIYLEGGKND